VDEDLNQMGENVNLVRAVVDSLDTSMKSVLERLEVLEKENTAKDKLIKYLSRCMIKLEVLGQSSGGEGIRKISSGSGRKEDPFELDDDQESWDDCPEGSSPEIAAATASPYPEHKLEVIVSCSECDREEGGDVNIQMGEEEEERGRESSLSDDTPLAMKVVESSAGGSHLDIPGVREEPKGPSYAGSGQGSVCSEGRLGRLSPHPHDLAKLVRDGSSFLRSQEPLNLIRSDESCHYEGNYSDVESDGSPGSGFLTDHSVELGSPFRKGGSCGPKNKVGQEANVFV